MKLLVIIALLFAAPRTQADDRPNQFVLLSYCIAKDIYRFALVSLADYVAFTNHASGHHREFRGAGYLRSVAELKSTMDHRVPAGSVIEWRGWKLADTCYPPKPIVDDIHAFARSRHIDVRLPEYGSTE